MMQGRHVSCFTGGTSCDRREEQEESHRTAEGAHDIMTNAFRTEHDLLGNRQVPAEVYYGVHTLRALENFPITGTAISIYPDLIRALAEIITSRIPSDLLGRKPILTAMSIIFCPTTSSNRKNACGISAAISFKTSEDRFDSAPGCIPAVTRNAAETPASPWTNRVTSSASLFCAVFGS